MAAISNLYIDAGSTFNAIVTVNGNDGNVLNLTGFSVAAQIKKSYAATTAYSLNATVYDALTGKVKISLPAAVSSAMKPGRYLYDIEITAPDNVQKLRAVEGLVIITPEITKI